MLLQCLGNSDASLDFFPDFCLDFLCKKRNIDALISMVISKISLYSGNYNIFSTG